jgi:RNA polymerase sigma-70 factor (ECF subfamily)
MVATPLSLLQQLRQPGEQQAWQRFVELYTPLLFRWGRHMGLQEQDAADLAQDVLALLVQKLPEFSYDRQRSFRGWLRTVTLNRLRETRRRRTVPLTIDEAALEAAAVADPADGFGQAEYRSFLAARALAVMRAEFQPATWRACWETVVAGRPAADVAAELGLSLGAVYVAKSRVLRRLRQVLDGLLE